MIVGSGPIVYSVLDISEGIWEGSSTYQENGNLLEYVNNLSSFLALVGGRRHVAERLK